MRRLFVAVFLAGVFPLALQAQGRAPDGADGLGPDVELDTISTSDEDPGGMRPYEEVIPPTAESDTGVITVHRVGDDYFFELPRGVAERQFLLQTRITKAPTGVGYAGERESLAVVRWERRSDRVLLRMVGHENSAPDSLPIFEAVESSNFEPILYAFDVEAIAPDSVSVVIDVSDFFTTDTPVLGLRQSRRERYEIRALRRDRTFIETIRSFPENLEVRRTVTYSANEAPTQQLAGVVSLELGHSLMVLPTDPMTPRRWDERVGYSSIRQNDYGAEEQRLVERRLIRRWRLEPSDQGAYLRGELVEPVSPIVFYLDPATPEEWRPYLKLGVEDWQEAFEAAGFRNAIVARDPPDPDIDPEFDPDDARYSVIRYLASPVRNASGPSYSDPRTGEILGAHIQWHHNVLNLVRNWYFVQTAAANPKARSVDFDDAVMGTLLRFVAAHEVGHTLGLPHNMKGHSAVPVDSLRTEWVCENGTSSSIMDYARFNYVAQPGDETCFHPRIGPYDRWAIEWGYRWFPEAMGAAEREKTLRDWILARGDDPMYRFGDLSGQDPGSTREVLSSDPVRASELGVANLKRILPNLLEWTFEEGETYEQPEELYDELVEQWSEYARHVTLMVGGIEWTRRTQGQKGQPYTPIAADAQRQALEYLDRQVFQTPAWLIEPQLLSRIEGTGIQDRIRDLQVGALDRLLGVNRMKRLVEREALDGSHALGLLEMLEKVRHSVWSELDDGSQVDAFRRDLQRGYLERVQLLLENDEARATDITPALRGELLALLEGVEKRMLVATHQLTRLHLADVAARISDLLDPEG